jgi:hypothetical protein
MFHRVVDTAMMPYEMGLLISISLGACVSADQIDPKYQSSRCLLQTRRDPYVSTSSDIDFRRVDGK